MLNYNGLTYLTLIEKLWDISAIPRLVISIKKSTEKFWKKKSFEKKKFWKKNLQKSFGMLNIMAKNESMNIKYINIWREWDRKTKENS